MAKVQKVSVSATGVFLKPNPAICLVYDVYDSRGRIVARKALYETQLRESRRSSRVKTADRRIRVCVDGDSWINILWPLSGIAGYNPTFFDEIQADFRYDTTSRAYPGDTFEQMLSEKDYRQPIHSGTFDFFIFSGGGNDVLGGGALVNLLRRRDEGNGTDPKAHIYMDVLKDTLKFVRVGYQEISDDVQRQSAPKRTRMLVNTYDYPIPRPNGVWIGQPLISKGYSLRDDKALIEGILKLLVDSFHDTLKKVRGITVVDVRNVVKGRWNDELHPKRAASKDLAEIYKAIMNPGVA